MEEEEELTKEERNLEKDRERVRVKHRESGTEKRKELGATDLSSSVESHNE